MEKHFNMYLKQYSVGNLHRMYHKKRPEISFDSDMQRGEVWSKAKSSLYIHSIFMDLTDYQSPFLVSKEVVDRKSTLDVLDGKQRGLTTLIRYIDNEYALSGVKEEPLIELNGEGYNINGKRFKQLPEDLQAKLLDCTINVAVMENATPEIKAMVFRRFNSGKPMNKFDLARSYKLDMSDITELSKHEIFEAMFSDKALKKLPQHEIVVKTYEAMFEEEPNFSAANINNLMKDLTMTPDQIEQISETYDKLFKAYKFIYADNEEIAKKLFDKTNLFSYIRYVDRFETEKKLSEWLTKFFADLPEDYANASIGHTTDAASVKTRMLAVKRSMDEFLGESQMTLV